MTNQTVELGHGKWGKWGPIAALVLGTFLVVAPGRASAATPPPTRAPVSALANPAPADGTPEDANQRALTYAQREARTPNAASFKGGDGAGIYISGSAVAVVLLVVVLVVLL
jgi:hypothetical protein